MMTLEKAINHCKEVAFSCTNKECALEHFQLLKWLQEYSNMLKKQGKQEEPQVYETEDGETITYSETNGYEAKKAVFTEKQEEQVSEEFINALGTMLNDGLPDRYLMSEERIKMSAELLFSIARKQLKNEMQEWSEEDKKLTNRIEGWFDTLCNYLKNSSNPAYIEDVKGVVEQFKSIKQKYAWKPSDKQLESLRCVNEAQWSNVKWKEIKSLYNDLKKL